MKKTLIIISILLLSIFTNVLVVNAYDFTVGGVYPFGSKDPVYIITDNYWGSSHYNRNEYTVYDYEKVNRYLVKLPTNAIKYIFCLDAGVPAAGSSDEVKVIRLLYSTKDDNLQAVDYAMSTILSNFENDSSDANYVSTLVALRVFVNGILHDFNPSWEDITGYYSKQNNLRYLSTAIGWADEDSDFASKMESIYKTLDDYDSKSNYRDYYIKTYKEHLNHSGTKYTRIRNAYKKSSNSKDLLGKYEYYFPIISNSYSATYVTENNYKTPALTGIISDAKSYVKEAMEAYLEAMKDTFSRPYVSTYVENTFYQGNGKTATVVSFRFDNFSTNYSKSYLNIINDPAITLVGYNSDYSADLSSYKRLNTDNIYELASKEGTNNKIYLLFEYDEPEKENTIIEYYYDDPFAGTGALFERNSSNGATGGIQRFVTNSEVVRGSLEIETKDKPDYCYPKTNFQDNCNESSNLVTEDGVTYVKATFQEGFNGNNLDIDKCIINNTDAKGNSYKVADFQNPYCTAYCKEDVEIKMPYKLETYAGRTINLDVKVKGVQSCYTKIDYTKYNNDTSRTDAEKSILLTACKLLDIDYKFEPTFGYEYEGFKVGTDGRTGILEQKSYDEKTTRTFYKDANYTIKDNDLKPAYVKVEKEINAVYTTPRKYYVNHNNRGLVSAYNYDKTLTSDFLDQNDIVDGLPISINTLGGTYEYSLTLSNIGTYYANPKDGLGRIIGTENSLAAIDKSDANNEYKCTYGVDNICIEVDNNNKEQYCDKDELLDKCQERLCPNQGEKANCIKEKGVYYICNSRRYDSTEGVCQRYGTSEADRQNAIKYAEKNGGKNVNCCPNCVIKIIPSCPACIITNGGTTLDYRTVSKVSLNPNGKTMGYNWNTDNTKYPELTIKAKYTIDEIESSEENKFNESTTDPEALTNSYLLRVEMTQSMADDIKKYNKAINKDGSYINSTMVCKDFVLEGKKKEDCTGDYKWDGKNCVIERILCYSTFIDELIDGDESGLIEGYAKQIKFGIDPDKSAVQVRKDLKNNNYTFKKYEYKVPGEPASSTVTVMSNGYWTIFPSFSKNYVGPSWK